eukprot:3401586-Heterocapsa_arctica.AAC.1
MTQEEGVEPMSLDHQPEGRPLDPAEVAEWSVSEAREEERTKTDSSEKGRQRKCLGPISPSTPIGT